MVSLKGETMRASKRSLFFKCPSSAIDSKISYAVAEKIATTGSVGHKAISTYIQTGEIDYDALMAACEVRDIDRHEVEVLAERGAMIWNRIGPQGEVSHGVCAEIDLPAYAGMTGTPDVRWSKDGVAHIVDWKLGREQRDCYHQLAQYAWLYRQELGAIGAWGEFHKIETHVYWVRLGQSEHRVFNDATLDEWLEYADEREQEIGRVFNPGDHCGFCPHVADCEPRLRWLRSSAAALTIQTERELTPPILGELYDRSKALKRALDAYDTLLSETLDSGHVVPLPDGRHLERAYRKVRQMQPGAAAAELRALGATDDEISGCLKTRITATDFDKVVRAHVARGQGKKAIDLITQRLIDSQSMTYREDKVIATKGEITNE